MLSDQVLDRNVVYREALREAALVPTAEQVELRTLVRGYLEKSCGEAALRRVLEPDPGTDRAGWQAMAGEQGLPALAIAESDGGLGYGFAELAVALEECGRQLAFPSLLTTAVLGAGLLSALPSGGPQTDWLAAIAAGELLVAVTGPGVPASGAPAVSARARGAQWLLHGTADFVLDGAAADLALVLCGGYGQGQAIFACRTDTPGLCRTPLQTLDLTRAQARYDFDGAEATLVADGEAAVAAWERMVSLGQVGIAAEQLGVAGQALDSAIEYAKSRHQFGRPIGSFQAIKHKCADLLIDLESARSAVAFAIWSASNGHSCLPLAAAVAKAAASEACTKVTAESIQIHGGIGFAWEHTAHLYFRRAKSDELLLGDGHHQRAAIGQLLGLMPSNA
ncbi:acyl-CoA dehydrogenase family protein [Arthrobacter bambusae]|uniref:acyl-CoA dehydrogenase family protein n=1 Tax=Arthrobacter bambusae TaxID=1338426 RepID=UPI002781F1FF|nr:acyl-CoA dehydrogenase family protein [Arthrobacter bambusae]MDQ0242123.1 alkylation response protein AidB-like acyl-CoA dehydrogenase [Arthrobacter bambusae]